MSLKISALILVLSCLVFSSCSGRDSASKENQSAVQPAVASAVSSETESVVGESSAASSAISSAVSSKPPSAASSKAPSTVSSAQPRPTATVTIPYGYSLSQIGDVLQAAGVCGKSDLLGAANSYDSSAYPVTSSIRTANRTYRLEGYLYPDTYQFYKNSKAADVISKMLRNAQSKIGSQYAYSGMTTDQLITLASIIQKEVKTVDDMKKVSSVYHNRLAAKMKLQADPTIVYIESYVKPNLAVSEKDRFNSYYNTYKCAALLAGPICSPGANALNAAAHPAGTDYMYFVYDRKNGQTYFAKTLDEHKVNCAKAGITSSGQSG